jgi:hypothetical protein
MREQQPPEAYMRNWIMESSVWTGSNGVVMWMYEKHQIQYIRQFLYQMSNYKDFKKQPALCSYRM